MNKKNYIVIEGSENDDDATPGNIHREDDGVSLRTMHEHGVVVEKSNQQSEESFASEESVNTLLSQNGIEIIKEHTEKEPEAL